MPKKLQVPSKARGKGQPKWIPPEERMQTYTDCGIGDAVVSKDDPRWKKVKWTKFCIVVPTEKDKKDLQAAFEYFHDNRLIDTDFITVNQLAHQYLEPPDGNPFILVDEDAFLRLQQKVCSHPQKYEQDGIVYCTNCWKALEMD